MTFKHDNSLTHIFLIFYIRGIFHVCKNNIGSDETGNMTDVNKFRCSTLDCKIVCHCCPALLMSLLCFRPLIYL